MNNEDIKVLENIINELEGETHYLLYTNKEKVQAIENLIARNKKLEEENEKIRKANKTLFELTQHTAMQEFINEDYIPKSKAEQLLKRLDKEEKEELKGTKGQDRYFIKQMYQAKRNAIQEFLQEGDK